MIIATNKDYTGLISVNKMLHGSILSNICTPFQALCNYSMSEGSN